MSKVELMFMLCNKNNWFTSGTVDQYDRLFDMVREGRKTKELALVIWICSIDWSEVAIYSELVANGFPK